MEAGRGVVLDHGLWLREHRDVWKKTVASAGGTWRLVYLPVQQDELLSRLAQRNQRQDANALTVTDSALKDFFARFQPAPDEDAIVYTGDTEQVYVAITQR